jgi:hypothetical protein
VPQLHRGHSPASGVATAPRFHATAPETSNRSPCGVRSQRAQIFRPFADSQADDVAQRADPQHDQRAGNQQSAILRHRLAALSGQVCRDRQAGQKQVGEVEQIAQPITPAAEEAVPVAETATRPHIQAALLGPPRAQAGHGQGRRHEEKDRRQQPQGQGSRTDPRRRRQPADTHDSSQVEEHEVAQAELALQNRRA